MNCITNTFFHLKVGTILLGLCHLSATTSNLCADVYKDSSNGKPEFINIDII